MGRRIRDLPLSSGRLYELMREGRGILLDPTGELSVAGWHDRVDRVAVAEEELSAVVGVAVGAGGILLRPDGHIVWVGTAQEAVQDRLEHWFGSVSTPT